ncbi:MAG TPA: hypothetical protein VLE53_06835 [Gemmatimonadaceae bacterium]|nr:hypothetical protein [Gemmatimonadaceae bacterium]
MTTHVGCLFALLILAACGSDPTGTPPKGLPPLDPVATRVRHAYQGEFNVSVPQPAIFNDPLANNCSGVGYLTTVAYLPGATPGARRMHVMHMSRDGTGFATTHEGSSAYMKIVQVPPAGTFKVLTVVLEWPTRFTSAELPHLVEAQRVINQQHADFAASRGYASPIVRFEFTNVMLARPDVADPRERDAVIEDLSVQGVDTAGVDFLAVVNIDPARPEGGFASPSTYRPWFAYMGNFGTFTSIVTASQVQSIANATYHHEIAHHWGWAHSWTPTCGTYRPFTPFITAPALFGWEDNDRDGTPEILDPTPYGRP